jgi:hypothetical protein
MAKVQIKNRYDSNVVVYECEAPEGTENTMKFAIEKAVAEKTYLGDAYLGGANLGGAYLGGVYLCDAYLGGANLCDAYLGGANLCGAYLGGANLRGAYLGDAYLRGAYLGDAAKKLVGDRPYFSIGPIGSRQDNLTLWITEKGPLLKTGCFGPDTFEAFRGNLERDHPAESTHRKEYEAALLMCEAHAVLWTPKTVEA